ncbi:hypothetical protein BG005_000117, partial [Podila minutissima]
MVVKRAQPYQPIQWNTDSVRYLSVTVSARYKGLSPLRNNVLGILKMLPDNKENIGFPGSKFGVKVVKALKARPFFRKIKELDFDQCPGV